MRSNLYPIKNATTLNLMRNLGKILAKILEQLKVVTIAGNTLYDIDKACRYLCLEFQVNSSCLSYRGYPASICVSVNSVACHGIPTKQVIQNGDIINLDLAINQHGIHADSSIMICVGNCSESAYKIVNSAYKAMWAGIKIVKPGISLYDIAYAIQSYVHNNTSFSIVEDFCGHGIGHKMHEEPQILHFVPKKRYYLDYLKNYILSAGMTFTIEPIINEGTKEIDILDDNWTAITKDGKLSAQWEHTVLVNEHGYEVLTML